MPLPTINPNARPLAVKYGAPAEGPGVIPQILDFTANATYQIDLSNLYNLKYLSAILTIYADNSGNSNPLIITVQDTGQVLTWPGYSQGYLPVMQGNSLKFTAASNGNLVVKVHMLNFPVAPGIWSTNATPIVTNGAVTVTDPTLESAVASGYFRSENFAVYGDGSINPVFVGSKVITGTLTATTATTIFTGAPGWVLTGLQVILSGDATLAAAGQLNVTAAESGGTTITNGRVYVSAAAPTNNSPFMNVINWQNCMVTSKVSASNFTLQTNVVPNAGELRYTATYGITNFVGG